MSHASQAAAAASSSAVPTKSITRWAARTLFFCAGFLFATWGVHIPTVKQVYAVDEAALGVAMLAAGIGALLGLSQAGGLIGRFGARPVSLWGGLASAGAIALLLVMPSFAGLLVLLLVFGCGSSLLDVAMNAEASELERREARPLMSGFHGMFSLGGMAGAALGSALLHAGVAPMTHVLAVAAGGALAVAWACTRMLPHVRPEAGVAREKFMVPRGVLLLLGAMAALGFIVEGAVYDWSVLYLFKEIGSPQNVAALAYASFSAAMALTRFGGDWMRARFSGAWLLRASALLAAASMAMVLLAGDAWVALAGFALVGVGLANVVPVLFSAAAQVPGVSAAQGIASVASMGYLGFMCGPPLIGFIAHASSLTAALYVVVGFAALLALGAPRAMRLAGGAAK
ncbi:MFS transporter [Rhodoferax koreense]|uniref:MFS transporter n=1 Tax=Rhodoferax koreensis TaxID=1842727 RepID=A0A1P8JWC8_9BURK|nr:MFS transporter [Rhodoferax koreense]APW37981.1 MFS transporter [Rhodoferax koreense]